jgi:hypothetical protein
LNAIELAAIVSGLMASATGIQQLNSILVDARRFAR